jgi:large conductance mechanosensitive channel
MHDIVKEFREFIARGNMIDLAVGIVLGIAFGAVINSFVNDILMAVIGSLVGEPNFNDLTVDIGDGVIFYGRTITAIVNFLLVGLALFVVVKAVNSLRRHEEKEPESTEKDILVEIRDLLSRRDG